VKGLEPRSRRRLNSLADDAVDAHNDTELPTSGRALSGVPCRRTRQAHTCRYGAPGGTHLVTFGARVRCAEGRAQIGISVRTDVLSWHGAHQQRARRDARFGERLEARVLECVGDPGGGLRPRRSRDPHTWGHLFYEAHHEFGLRRAPGRTTGYDGAVSCAGEQGW
jgi:hypothetical protein